MCSQAKTNGIVWHGMGRNGVVSDLEGDGCMDEFMDVWMAVSTHACVQG